MKNTVSFFTIKTIRFYQKTFSPDKGFFVKIGLKTPTTCVFYPTCSEYTIQAIKKYGTTKGLFKGFRRVLRCTPWQKNKIDLLK